MHHVLVEAASALSELRDTLSLYGWPGSVVGFSQTEMGYRPPHPTTGQGPRRETHKI